VYDQLGSQEDPRLAELASNHFLTATKLELLPPPPLLVNVCSRKNFLEGRSTYLRPSSGWTTKPRLNSLLVYKYLK